MILGGFADSFGPNSGAVVRMEAVVIAFHSRIEFLDFNIAAWSQVPMFRSQSRGIVVEVSPRVVILQAFRSMESQSETAPINILACM